METVLYIHNCLFPCFSLFFVNIRAGTHSADEVSVDAQGGIYDGAQVMWSLSPSFPHEISR
jgi:hypothetical protein